MRKKIIIWISIIVAIIVVIVFIAIGLSKQEINENIVNGDNNIYVSEKVTDDCIQDVEQIAKTNSSEERISPNSLFILKKYYKKCKHTINEYAELPAEFVNMTLEELEKEYKDWEIIGFSNSEITLYKEFDGECNEHFILKDEKGKIAIYRQNNNGTEELFKQTDISTEFLTETDLIKIKNGFKIYGEEELNKVLEDFE